MTFTTEQVKAAAWESASCLDCGTRLERVAREYVSVGKCAHALGSFCGECAGKRSARERVYVPCGNCERLVSSARPHPRHGACCGRCLHELELADKRRKRQPRKCAVCTQPFTPKRKTQVAHVKCESERKAGTATALVLPPPPLLPRRAWHTVEAKSATLTRWCEDCRELTLHMPDGSCAWIETHKRTAVAA